VFARTRTATLVVLITCDAVLALTMVMDAQEPIQVEPLPGLIYSSYGEESGDGVLSSSGSPTARNTAPLPIDRNPASPDFDAWNELFQTYYEMSSATPEERVQRGGKTYQIYEHFVHTAKQVARHRARLSVWCAGLH
jgi:hypothetical protein